jgi:hypothetical protein
MSTAMTLPPCKPAVALSSPSVRTDSGGSPPMRRLWPVQLRGALPDDKEDDEEEDVF